MGQVGVYTRLLRRRLRPFFIQYIRLLYNIYIPVYEDTGTIIRFASGCTEIIIAPEFTARLWLCAMGGGRTRGAAAALAS